jgi:hypothetical protein
LPTASIRADRLNNNYSFLSQFLSANALDLVLAVLTQEVEANTVILVRFNQMVETVFELEELHLLQIALKDAILHPLTEVFQRFEDAATTLVVYDVVRNYNEHTYTLFNFLLSCPFWFPLAHSL